jgi:hypothetical protein
MNTHVRDNFLETAPAWATGAGQVIVTAAANTLRSRSAVQSDVQTSQTTMSTSYTDLATAGPTLSGLATGTTALIFVNAFMQNDTAGAQCFAAVDVSGASSSSPSDQRALRFEASGANDVHRGSTQFLYSGLTAGANTFKVQYRVSAGTGTFANRAIFGVSLS